MIGMFDSGSGGLTVLRALRDIAPDVDVVYFGDLANMPYGTKDHATLERLTFQAMRFLRSEGATCLLSACNSVSASVIRPMLELWGVRNSRVIEMVGPTARALATLPTTRVVILVTPATADSGIYQSACAEVGIKTVVIPCSTLAAHIEHGVERSIIQQEIAAICKEAIVQQPSHIVLGCTHYPLVASLFRECLAGT